MTRIENWFREMLCPEFVLPLPVRISGHPCISRKVRRAILLTGPRTLSPASGIVRLALCANPNCECFFVLLGAWLRNVIPVGGGADFPFETNQRRKT